jgi:hypothetical protein
MSMSMPNTCAPTQSSVAASTVVACQSQLIPRLLLPVNHAHLRTYCKDSLARVCSEYSISQDMPVVCQLRASIPDMSFTNSLALFFLLLNIDTGLKQGLMHSEARVHQGKCANFFMNLRRHVIPEFLSIEACDAVKFTAQCEDAWRVA